MFFSTLIGFRSEYKISSFCFLWYRSALYFLFSIIDYTIYAIAEQPCALCTESHVWYIFLEPTIDCRVERVNGNGQVVAHHILMLVVGEDPLHGCGTGPTDSWRYEDIQVAIHV